MAAGTGENFDGRTVVITGASAGVGRALAHRFAHAGASLGLIGRDESALQDVKREIISLGGAAMEVACDMADPSAVLAAADKIADALGPIDVWINNAMLTVFSRVGDITPDEFRRVTEVTYLGYVHGTMAALRHMAPRNRGAIVQVGSALAYRAIPLQSAYCGAKHAIRGFTDALRSELIHDGSAIRLTMVQLPAVNTPQFNWARTHLGHEPRPVPPVVQPESVADAIFRAALRGRREYWIGWSTIFVILTNMVAPGLLDAYLARRAYETQERTQLAAPDRPDNLFRPIHDLHRTRGDFGQEASASVSMWSGNSARLAAAGLMIGVGMVAILLLARLAG